MNLSYHQGHQMSKALLSHFAFFLVNYHLQPAVRGQQVKLILQAMSQPGENVA